MKHVFTQNIRELQDEIENNKNSLIFSFKEGRMDENAIKNSR